MAERPRLLITRRWPAAVETALQERYVFSLDALAAGTIRAAGLDLFKREPKVVKAVLPPPNAVLLPHLGSAVADARVAMGMRVVANVDCFFAGEELLGRVA